MRISKRDAQLLILLAVVLVAASFYWLVYLPQEMNLQTLKDEKILLDQQRTAIDSRIAVEATLDSDIDKAKLLLLNAGERYYATLYQEVLMMTINELLNGSGVEVRGVAFSEQLAQLSELMADAKTVSGTDPFVDAESSSDETPNQAPVSETPTEDMSGQPLDQLATTEVNTLTAQIMFKGYYEELEIFLFNLYQYPKHIVLQSLNIANDQKGLLTGTITLEFYGLPKIGVATTAIQEYFKSPSQRASVADVYLPYSTFVIDQGSETQVDPSLNFTDGSFGSVPQDGNMTADTTNPDDTTGLSGEVVPVEVKPPSELITSFEVLDYFFTGNKKSIQGSGALSAKRTEGNYGLLVQYNFIEPNQVNTANIVFDEKPLLVNKAGKALSVNVYAEGPLKHRIAAELVDISGKTYDLTFAPGHEGGGWKTFEVAVPDAISYPFVIKRIYFEGTGINQQLVAEVVLDELRLMLPDLGGSK